VELAALQEPADRRVEGLVRREEAGADPLLRVAQERAELEDRERPEVAADTGAAVEDRAAARQLDRERDQQRHGEQQEEAGSGDRHLPPPPPAPVGPEPEVAARRVEALGSLCTQADHGASGLACDASSPRRELATAATSLRTRSSHTTSTSSAQMARLWSTRRVMCSATSRPTAAGSKSPWRRSRDGASRSWRSEEHTSELQSPDHLV